MFVEGAIYQLDEENERLASLGTTDQGLPPETGVCSCSSVSKPAKQCTQKRQLRGGQCW